MTNKYELKTIKDIFHKVPIDRVGVLFDELQILMEQAALVNGFEFPDKITWVDDGKGEVVLSIFDKESRIKLAEITAMLGVNND